MANSFFLAQSMGWSDFLTGIESDQRFVLLIVAIGCSVAIVLGLAGIITGMVSSIHRRRAEMDLKREMIERGMSADDIAKIIESTTPPEDAT